MMYPEDITEEKAKSFFNSKINLTEEQIKSLSIEEAENLRECLEEASLHLDNTDNPRAYQLIRKIEKLRLASEVEKEAEANFEKELTGKNQLPKVNVEAGIEAEEEEEEEEEITEEMIEKLTEEVDTEDTEQMRKLAFLTFLVLDQGEDIAIEEIEEIDFSDKNIEYCGCEYMVLSEEEAEEEAEEYISNSLCYFNAEFIASYMVGSVSFNIEAVKALQEKIIDEEELNDHLKQQIVDFGYFVSEAISFDGRGHFLSSYDGNEEEIEIAGEYFYIYRTN